MTFTTPIQDYSQAFLLKADYKTLALGSCFAQVVGKRMADLGLCTLLNPTGTLYNPMSIALTLQSAMDIAEHKATAYEVADNTLFMANDGKWYSWMAASLIQGQSREECSTLMAGTLNTLADRIAQLDVLLLTFGTDHYYTLRNNTDIPAVTNCHKMPAAMFEEKIMDTSEIVALLSQTVQRLLLLRPDLHIIMSVSPYRYLKYGLHNSRLSKARLLLATDEITRLFPQAYYFPAYEIMNDELRDYRFYAADMLHPSDVAEQFIWQKFCDNYMDATLRQSLHDREKALKAAAHRPLHP